MSNPIKTLAAIMLMTAMMFVEGCKSVDEPNNGGGGGLNDADVRVTTYTPQDITATTAVCGGDVIVIQGLTLNALGVCWSENPNPTVEDSHLSTSNWSEPYVCTITGLEPNTTYHVRAYALRGLEYYYGDEKSFTTKENGGGNGTYQGHNYVDLGLPSGTLWATCNVGATTPEGYGDYFAWGETQPKPTYKWSTYQYCNGDYNKLTKYCSQSEYGYNGFTDNLITLLPEDDAATTNWGSGWRMPTSEQWEELRQNTTNTWTTLNGVNGRLFTASNGNSLFLPAAGSRWEVFSKDGDYGFYWSSTLSPLASFGAVYFIIYSNNSPVSDNYRFHGWSVRAVRSAR